MTKEQTVIVTPTASEVEAAKLRVALDRRMGVKSAAIIEKLATAKAHQTFQLVLAVPAVSQDPRVDASDADSAGLGEPVDLDPIVLRLALEAALSDHHASAVDEGYDVRFWSPDRKTEYLMGLKVSQRQHSVRVFLAEKGEGDVAFRPRKPFELALPDDLAVGPADPALPAARH